MKFVCQDTSMLYAVWETFCDTHGAQSDTSHLTTVDIFQSIFDIAQTQPVMF